MKIVTVIGARPQFIKAAAVSRVIHDEYAGIIEEVLVHTGQHFDDNMSKVFFEELDIPHPKYNLEISGLHQHGAMTGRMLEAVENVIINEKPDCLLIYGDTNSTLAGALAAAKLHVPVAHVEAGLRSFNMHMPEEINRIISDRVSSLLFCPTETAVDNLKAEGIVKGVYNVGDVMYDVALLYRDRAKQQSPILKKLKLSERSFVLATCHRAENTDNPIRLADIMSALTEITRQMPVVFALHPRTRKLINEYGLDQYLNNFTVTEPLSFLDMVALEQAAKAILTDSGGVQKEAYFYQVPCLTIRDETEWIETVDLGWNQLVGADRERIVKAFTSVNAREKMSETTLPYGAGDAACKIVESLKTYL